MIRISFATTILVLLSCGTKNKTVQPEEYGGINTNLEQLDFTVEPSSEWSQLLKRNSGWFGGDGIFALVRSGNESDGAAQNEDALIWFSDTMLGEIVEDSLQPGFTMINNSIAVLTGGKPNADNVSFHWDKTTDDKPTALFKPTTPATGTGEYYWLGDGFVNHKKNNNIYIFGYRIVDIPNQPVFGFKEMGNTLIVIPAGEQPPFPGKRQLDIPFWLNRGVDTVGTFGAGIFVNTTEAGASKPDGFVYVYGVRGANKELLVARFKPEDVESFDQWLFWNGQEWINNPDDAKPIADNVSNELSVSELGDGRYIMVFQKNGLSSKVAIRLGSTPYGPFGSAIDIFDTSEDTKDSPNFFPYNAKAHPVLSKPGELLISFNVNSFDFFNEITRFPHLYRPRFITLKYSNE